MIIGSIAVIAGCIAGTVLLKKSNKLLESGDIWSSRLYKIFGVAAFVFVISTGFLLAGTGQFGSVFSDL